MKKKLIALLLAASMLITGQLPVLAAVELDLPESAEEFAGTGETEKAQTEEKEQTDEGTLAAVDPATLGVGAYGKEVDCGGDGFFIMDGVLYRTGAEDASAIVARDVTWLVAKGGVLYYAKTVGYNTDIHTFEPKTGDDSVLVRVFVPVEAFDVYGNDVYYLYNGEVAKVNTVTGEDATVCFDPTMTAFYVEDGDVVEATIDDEEPLISEAELAAVNTSKYDNVIVDRTFWYWPAQQGTINWNNINSLFGYRTYNNGTWHGGIDIPVDHVKVYASKPGIVIATNNGCSATKNTKCGCNESRGNYITIYHGKIYWENPDTNQVELVPIYSTYMHLQQNSLKVAVGDEVQMGQEIAISAGSGHGDKNGYGLHLHFQLNVNKVHGSGSEKNLKHYFISTIPVESQMAASKEEANKKGILYETSNSDIDGLKLRTHSIQYTFSTCSHTFTENKNGHCDNPECNFVFDYKGTKTYDGVGVYVTKYTTKLFRPSINLYAEPYMKSTVKNSGKFESLVIVGRVTNALGNVWYETDKGLFLSENTLNDAMEYSPLLNQILFENINSPDTSAPIKKKPFELSGTIKSTKLNIDKITGSIIDANTEAVVQTQDDKCTTNYKEYKIDKSIINSNLKFGSLKDGSYYLKYDVVAGGKTSTWKSETFTVGTNPPPVTVYYCTAPTFSPYTASHGQGVRLSCAQSGAKIYYTVNGGAEQSGTDLFFTEEGSYNIRAWATRSGMETSSVVSYTVTVARSAAPVFGEIVYAPSETYVTLSGSGNVYYTTDGSTPTESSSLNPGRIVLTGNTTIKAIAAEYGKQISPETLDIVYVSAPDATTVYSANDRKVAQGRAVSVSWDASARAASYTAILRYGGSICETCETQGTSATFSLPNAGTYSITVRAENSIGSSAESAPITFESVAPLTVTFVDRVVRENGITDQTVSDIQFNLDTHYGSSVRRVEGTVISRQKVDYGSKPVRPATTVREGFTFAGYSDEMYLPVYQDTTVGVLFEVNFYPVEYFDVTESNERRSISRQNVYYTGSAVRPDNVTVPAGYVFAGWNIDGNSKCTDDSFVCGPMSLDAAFKWGNEDLPVVVSISGVTRKNKSYAVSVRVKNNPTHTTQGRLVTVLYTSTGKMVYTQMDDLDLDLGKLNDWTEKVVELNYTEKIHHVCAYVLAVDDGKTSGMLSEEASFEGWTPAEGSDFKYWSDWSAWQTELVTADENTQVELMTLYIYNDLETTTSTTNNYLAGYGSYTYRDTYVGNFSGWSRSEYASVDNVSLKRDVERRYVEPTYKTQYRYGRWTNGAHTVMCPDWGGDKFGGSWRIEYTAWSDTQNYTWNWKSDKGRPAISYCTNHSHNHYAVNFYDPSDNSDCWYQRYVTGYNDVWYWEETQQVQTGGGYYEYRYRDTTYTYHFSRWGDEYVTETPVYASSTRRVTSTKNYRYKTASLIDKSTESPDVWTHHFSGVISNTSSSFAGKKAVAMIYKRTNTDPTEAQMEYVKQIVIGSGNTFDFTANTREAPDYVKKTGDFIVCLAIEGCNRLINVDVFEQPRPQYTVTFSLPDGSVFATKTVSEGDSLDVNEIGIPSVTGSRFVKWDRSVVNITENISTVAIMTPEPCFAVYVDHVNETAEIVQYRYGDPLSLPTPAYHEGKKFVRWDTGDDMTIRANRIITAVWEDVVYTVTFRDFDGNVVGQPQSVAHGHAATPPAMCEKNGVPYAWDVSAKQWWNVTEDMDVYPYEPIQYTAAPPTISFPTDETCSMFEAVLSTEERDGKIYYAFSEITETDAATYLAQHEHEYFDKEDDASPAASLLADEEEPGEEFLEEDYGPSAIDFIEEYTEPLTIYAGDVLYAFSVSADGNISPIAVFAYDPDDRTDSGAVISEYLPSDESQQILLPRIRAYVGDTVQIPMTIKNNPGLTDLTLILHYDTAKLTLTNAVGGDVFGEGGFSYDVRPDGSGKLSWHSDTVRDADGVLATLSFTVDADCDGTMLETEYESASDGEEDRYFYLGKGGITMTKGDLNGDGEVDYNDAILILKHDVGIAPLPENALSAADVNGDGEADFADAIRILMIDAGLAA